MHFIPNTPTISKNSLPLKEVLMSATRHFPHGLSHNLKSGMRGGARNARKPQRPQMSRLLKVLIFSVRPQFVLSNNYTNFCRPKRESAALKTGAADSESGILAMKIFFGKTRSRLIGAGHNRTFCQLTARRSAI